MATKKDKIQDFLKKVDALADKPKKIKYKRLKSAGFSDAEIKQWEQDFATEDEED